MSDEEIFAEAVGLEPRQRNDFLEKACAADPARRARIARLVSAHFQQEVPAGY